MSDVLKEARRREFRQTARCFAWNLAAVACAATPLIVSAWLPFSPWLFVALIAAAWASMFCFFMACREAPTRG